MPKWQWVFSRFSKKLWFRTAIFFFIGICTAVLSYFLKQYIPEEFAKDIGSEAVDSILHIIASSMLAVTTFSLSVMVSAYASASSSATPRATHLLLEDSTTQNALSVFIGAFVFSLVGIVTLKIGLYEQSGRLVLLVVTLGVIFCVVIMLLKWIEYLSRLGRLDETLKMVENATLDAIQKRLNKPYLGGVKLEEYVKHSDHIPILQNEIGYVQNIDMQKLSQIAEAHELTVFVRVLPGHFNDAHTPIAFVSTSVDEQTYKNICHSFTIDKYRSFEQDPRFGFIVLNEVAARALSSSINDHGTAIGVIGRMIRLLMVWVTHQEEAYTPQYPRIQVPAITLNNLFDDNFNTIARDGAGMLEVGIRLQKGFSTLATSGNPECEKLAKYHSMLAFRRAEKALLMEEDLEKLRKYISE